MIVHQMFEVLQGEAERSESATIAGVNVSHVYLLPEVAPGDWGSDALWEWGKLTETYLTVVMRAGGRQEILLSRMPLPALIDISDILMGFHAVTIPLGNLRLRGSDSLTVQLELQPRVPDTEAVKIQVGVLDTGLVAERVVGYETVVGETSVTAEAPRRIFAHRLAWRDTAEEHADADVTFELRFGGQHGSLSWRQCRLLTDVVKRGESGDVSSRTVVLYDDRHGAVGTDVSVRVIRGTVAEPIAIYIEKEVRLPRQNFAEVAEDARARVEQVRQARGDAAAARLAVQPEILPAILGERVATVEEVTRAAAASGPSIDRLGPGDVADRIRVTSLAGAATEAGASGGAPAVGASAPVVGGATLAALSRAVPVLRRG